ncbi:hypothetical protein PV327_000843 [Microctonus hyperodae]|uniref:Uncharacterized protein n=1 Tax=Microctonus hyperodae TaxID=165561 RepID=A0AA39L2T2_MICHY|nr:hypothetical protein PV327_000843 [Microctonus hyperodae]
MARKFLIIDCFNFISAIVIYLLMTVNYVSSMSEASTNVCSMEDCREVAEDIFVKMDKNVKPCDDFYRFVCGNYIKHNAPTWTQLDLYEEMQKSSRLMYASLLENENSMKILNKPFRQISKLYKLCMDQSTLIKQGAKPLLKILRELGGWPILEGNQWSNEMNNDWTSITGNLIKFGFPFDLFTKFSIINSSQVNTHSRVILLDRPLIKYNLDRHSLDSVDVFYNDSVINAIKLGVSKEKAEDELKKSQELLIDLINITKNTKINSQVMYLNGMSTRWPSINWTGYFASILSISSATPIDTNDLFIVDDFYIDELVRLMNKTRSRVLMNYALSRVVEESLIYIRLENITHLSSSRVKLCFDIIAEHLPNIFDATFALNYVDDNKRNEATAMVNTIREQFIKIIQQADWLSNKTQQSAVEKLMSIISMIGYLDEWKTEEWMKQYNNFEIDEENLLRSILNIIRFKTAFRYQTHDKHIDDKKHIIRMDRMPYYASFKNTIIISAGFLQHVLFNNNLPKYINYGRMGFFIGHEIAHSFDDIEELSKINKNLMESSKKKFHEETTCMINQYSNYKVEAINSKLNGESSVHENIADNSGAKLAYLAYRDWLTRNGLDPMLPHLNYTSSQMFWINMAIPWCTRIHPKILKDLVNEKHSPAEFRVIGAVSNNDNFSRDFNCSLGSKMNPVKKCNVW